MTLHKVFNVAAGVLSLLLIVATLVGTSLLALRHVVFVTGPLDGFPLLMLAAIGLGSFVWLAQLVWRDAREGQ